MSTALHVAEAVALFIVALGVLAALGVVVLLCIGTYLTARDNRAKRLHRRARKHERTLAEALAQPVASHPSCTPLSVINRMEHEWTPTELVELGLAVRIPDSEWMTNCVMLIDPFKEPWRLTF